MVTLALISYVTFNIAYSYTAPAILETNRTDIDTLRQQTMMALCSVSDLLAILRYGTDTKRDQFLDQAFNLCAVHAERSPYYPHMMLSIFSAPNY